jgi:hypothetical protein
MLLKKIHQIQIYHNSDLVCQEHVLREANRQVDDLLAKYGLMSNDGIELQDFWFY